MSANCSFASAYLTGHHHGVFVLAHIFLHQPHRIVGLEVKAFRLESGRSGFESRLRIGGFLPGRVIPVT